MWVKRGRCPSHSIRFLFFIHELIKLFPSYAAPLSRKVPLPEGLRPAVIHHPAPSRGRKWPGLPGGGLPLIQGCQLFSPHVLRGDIRTLSPWQPPRLCPWPKASYGSSDPSIWSPWNSPKMPDQHLKSHMSHTDFLLAQHVLLGVPRVSHLCGLSPPTWLLNHK